jgi:Rps23 Pro-64 3,4-dihydroxylase Tpa1-like proline 4-hydroxylase
MLTHQGRQESIRTDTLGWFDCSSQPSAATSCAFEAASSSSNKNNNSKSTWPHIQALLQRIETLVSELGSAPVAAAAHTSVAGEFALCTSRTKVMVTRYEGRDDDSSRYTPHVDNGNKNGRKCTAIYYMNEGWKRPHGGALR